MAITKTEAAELREAITKLRGTTATREVREALTGPCKLYLETWVIPKLERILAKHDRSQERKNGGA